jgi:hypothetical protein
LLESELVNGWVKFLVGLLVFKQVVDEASQCACGGRCGLGRSKVGLFTPVEDAKKGLGHRRAVKSKANHRGEQVLDMLLEIAFTIHAVHLRFSQQRIYGVNAILYAQGKTTSWVGGLTR